MPATLWRKTSEGRKAIPKCPPLPWLEQPGRGAIRAFFREARPCLLSFTNHIIRKEALRFWSECFWAEKKDISDVGIDAGIYRYLPHQDNLFFLPVIPVEQTTPPDNSKQMLKLSVCTGLAEFNVQHKIKCLAETRCKHSWLTWSRSKGCRSSWSIIATTEQISFLQTALGSALFPLSTKQSHAQSQFSADFQRTGD